MVCEVYLMWAEVILVQYNMPIHPLQTLIYAANAFYLVQILSKYSSNVNDGRVSGLHLRLNFVL
jgi:hypothetical protein